MVACFAGLEWTGLGGSLQLMISVGPHTQASLNFLDRKKLAFGDDENEMVVAPVFETEQNFRITEHLSGMSLALRCCSFVIVRAGAKFLHVPHLIGGETMLAAATVGGARREKDLVLHFLISSLGDSLEEWSWSC